MHNPNKKKTQTTSYYAKSTGKIGSSKSKSKSGKKRGEGNNLFAFLKSDRMIQIYGLLLVLFSLLLLVSIVSYLFTHTADNNCVYHKEAMHGNVAGTIGAYISYFFTNYFFGVYSLGFVFLFFIYGMRLILGRPLLPLFKSTITTFLTMAWLSMATGFWVEGGSREYLAGFFGNFTSSFLLEKTGVLVSVLITVGTLIIICILGYDFSLKNFADAWIRMRGRTREQRLIRQEKRREKRLADQTKKDAVMQKKDAKKKRSGKNEKFNDENTELGGLYIENREGLAKEFSGSGTIYFDVEGMPEEVDVQKEKNDEEEDIPFSIVNTSQEKEVDEEVENVDNESDAFKDEEMVRPEMLEDYDPRKDLSTYKIPGVELLKDHTAKEVDAETMRKELMDNKVKIETTLKNFNIPIKSITATIGPTVTLYEIVPTDGIRINKIKNLEDDIALNLAALGIRIIAPIPGKGTIGIEVPNRNPKIVSMREVIESDRFQHNKFDLPIGLGKTISNESFVVDLAKMPHLLMAGATGQGKSVGLNAIITSLLYKKHPSEIKFVMIDPKKVEFSLYTMIENHYLAKLPDMEDSIITDTKKVIRTLNSLCKEMDDRYDLLKIAKTRNIKEYNAKFCSRQLSPANGHRFLPYIILLIDEFGDLIMTAGREVEVPIARLAQLARAIGIHLIIATQRPSVNIITGTIKANFPARIAFRVSSKIDSRTILDSNGADQLIGKGDMLISTGSDLIRLQCAFVDTPEVEEIVKYIEDQQSYSEPYPLPEVPDNEKGKESGMEEEISTDKIDDFFMDAASLIVQTQQGSTSLIQRKLSLGYNRAGRIMDQLEEFGIVGVSAGSKAREVKIKTLEDLREVFNRMGLL